MPSPFPGMDPYLEASFVCPDFHLTMTVAIQAELNGELPARYAAAVDRYVWIPLDPGETDVRLPLRSCLDRAYEEGRYIRELDYTSPPDPPLAGPDVQWAVEVVRQAGPLDG